MVMPKTPVNIYNCLISNILSKNKIWEKHMHNIFEQYVKKDSIVLISVLIFKYNFITKLFVVAKYTM